MLKNWNPTINMPMQIIPAPAGEMPHVPGSLACNA